MDEKIRRLMASLGLPVPLAIRQFSREEDDGLYDVWQVDLPDQRLVVKKAKGREEKIYRTFFQESTIFAPELLGTAGEYLVMEYIPGENLCFCTREKLKVALDSLIAMQDKHWQLDPTAGADFDHSLAGRINRGNYLQLPELEAVYKEFLEEYATVPRTLCHDDLLPFNVIVNDDRAVMIDWEVGGILPYPVSLARLIAHGEEETDAFFHMTAADKTFALDYYYEHFAQHKGISRETYDRTMQLFLFYELCEWIYLGNRYPDADMDRYRSYMDKALTLAEELECLKT